MIGKAIDDCDRRRARPTPRSMRARPPPRSIIGHCNDERRQRACEAPVNQSLPSIPASARRRYHRGIAVRTESPIGAATMPCHDKSVGRERTTSTRHHLRHDTTADGRRLHKYRQSTGRDSCPNSTMTTATPSTRQPFPPAMIIGPSLNQTGRRETAAWPRPSRDRVIEETFNACAHPSGCGHGWCIRHRPDRRNPCSA